MLTLPDFNQKRVLSIHAEYGHENILQLSNDNIRFTQDNVLKDQITCHNIFAVIIIGEMTVTTALIKKLVAQGISIFFLNHNLVTKAAVMADSEGNFLLRQKQYTCTNELEIATNIVLNKIRMQEKTLTKSNKEYLKKPFRHASEEIKKSPSREILLGIEGNCAKTYFQSLFKEYGWVRRAPQTKEDTVNLLLDIGYTYLFNYCDTLLRLFGFDTYKGCYHQLFFQRKSLSCDIMEPLRPIIDYQIIKSYNLKQIKEKDFTFKNNMYEFKDGFKTAKLYNRIFLEVINYNKGEIYNYILGYYRYTMDSNKYPFPVFDIT